jgi:hypothetical protein
MPGGVDAHVHLCQDLKTGTVISSCSKHRNDAKAATQARMDSVVNVQTTSRQVQEVPSPEERLL